MADTPDTNTQGGADAPFTEQVKDQVKQQTQQVVQQGQQYAGQAVDLLSTRVKSALGQQKDHLAAGVTDVAQVVKQSADDLRGKGLGSLASPYIDQVAQKLTDFGMAAQQKDIDEVIRDTEDFARLQPAAFVGIAALVGFVAARFLKSSAQAAASA